MPPKSRSSKATTTATSAKSKTVSSVAQLAALSAAAMKTTVKVGDPSEDASMKHARPILSRINEAGFVTIDSQMGDLESAWYKQRAYVSGIIAKSRRDAIMRALHEKDVIAISMAHRDCKWIPDAGKIYLTVSEIKPAGGGDHTGLPVGNADSFETGVWLNLLPELELKSDKKSMAAIKKDSCLLHVIDAVWGRKRWLFDQVLDALRKSQSNTST